MQIRHSYRPFMSWSWTPTLQAGHLSASSPSEFNSLEAPFMKASVATFGKVFEQSKFISSLDSAGWVGSKPLAHDPHQGGSMFQVSDPRIFSACIPLASQPFIQQGRTLQVVHTKSGFACCVVELIYCFHSRLLWNFFPPF